MLIKFPRKPRKQYLGLFNFTQGMEMDLLIVLNVIALSVALAFVITPATKNNTSNPTNIDAPNKKCPHCSEETDADAIKCKHCGSRINVLGKNREGVIDNKGNDH